ncbi:MAG: carboxypeptidase regulatory-like domain-containing protein, partial [Chloroflexota bacterium]|nr:carboxypeptidase regulatory-like domain-containing protein [Chloroflexota bacterium]
APGIPSGDILDNGETIQFLLPTIEQDNIIAILIGLAIPPNDGNNKEYAASAMVNLTGDIDPSNNEDSVIVQNPPPAPVIGVFMDYTDDALLDYLAGGRAATCQANPTLGGQAAPNSTVEILIDGRVAGTANADSAGSFRYPVMLRNGLRRIAVRYPGGVQAAGTDVTALIEAQSIHTLLLKVDSSLPLDPLSLTFTDSGGRVVHPQTLAAAFQGTQIGALNLRSGESYAVGINRCVNDPNLTLRIELENTLIANLLHDEDGDGRYTGSFTFDAGVQAAAVAANAQLRFNVTTGGAEQRFITALQPLTAGIVRHASSGQPLAGASVTALAVAGLAQPTPALTGADGGYSFNVPDGLYRLTVGLAGYQPYRSAELAVTTGALAQNIALTPALSDAATHTILITENGFEPALLTVPPGSVIEWVNISLLEHSATQASSWDSGLLAMGDSYKVRLDSQGTYSYADDTDGLNQATIVVAGGGTSGAKQVFLPLVNR